MSFTTDLEYTPYRPQEGLPFTEAAFSRRPVPFTLNVCEVGIALVDLWNFGWNDGPVSPSLGPDLGYERGRSHALRKRHIIESVIAPTANAMRDLGMQIFHCNHGRFLEAFPQWQTSITQEERQAHWEKANAKITDAPEDLHEHAGTGELTSRIWHPGWQEHHQALVWMSQQWSMKQRNELYPHVAIPAPVRPKGDDLLICERNQFRRLLTERGIHVLFYMGFETDCCLIHNQAYGIAKMTGPDCPCVVVRDGTTIYEAAETLAGGWRTRVAVLDIESRYGYSVTSSALVNAVTSDRRIRTTT